MIDLSNVDYYYDIYRKAIDASSRRISFTVELSVISQEIEYTDTPEWCSAQSPLSRLSQVHDMDSKVTVHGISMELNRWIIGDMSFVAYDTIGEDIQIGSESHDLAPTVRSDYGPMITFKVQKAGYVAGIGIDFLSSDVDGYATDLWMEVGRGNTPSEAHQHLSYADQYYYGNTERSIFVPLRNNGMTDPTYVRVQVKKWSLPNRRARMPEIWVGYHDVWGEDRFSSISISQKASLVPFSIPYTTCTLQLDNSDRLFDPTNKYGLFRSIEDRQPVIVAMNAMNVKDLYDPDGLPSRFFSYFTVGSFYQYDNGWKTGNSDLTMTWNLVDLLGLLADRKFDITKLKEKPYYGETIINLVTVEDWVKEILGQLGKRFASMYDIPYEYAITILPKVKKSMFVDVTCGDVLTWICQYLTAWMRLTPDGKIYIGKFERLGQDTANRDFDLKFSNLIKYPILKANDSIARIDFSILRETSRGLPIDESEKAYALYSEDQSSSNTESVSNPFIRSQDNTLPQKASELANYAFQWYGGNQIETSNRGNPIRELGDLVYVEISKGAYSLGRVIEQTFEINDHVMTDCKTTLVCVDAIGDYNAYVVLTRKDNADDGYVYWTVPDNLELDEYGNGHLKVVLVQAGQTGGHGLPTTWEEDEEYDEGGYWIAGSKGDNGLGGKINVITNLDEVKRGQLFTFSIGQALEPRSTVQYRYEYGGNYLDMWPYAEDGKHTVGYWDSGYIGSSEDGIIYPDGYMEPVSGKMLGRAHRGVPSPDSGDGGASGESAYAYLENTDYTPDDMGGRKALAGGIGVKGADGCVIICYKAGPDNTDENNI